MSTKYTSGPWMSSTDNRGQPFVCTKRHNRPHALIAEIFTPSAIYNQKQSVLDEEAAANALLIAAAPDLLNAANFAINEIEKWNDGKSHNLGAAFEDLVIAVAKAKGGIV